MIATECPTRSRLRARLEPTRPQPMMTMCTSGRYRDRTAPNRPGHPLAPGRANRTLDRVSLLTRVAKRLVIGRPVRSDRLAETAAAQADRAARLRQRPAVLGGVRDAGDPARAHARRLARTCTWRRGWRRPSSLLLAIVVASYRQTCHAYPSGGGDYAVATTNLGRDAALVVASALLVDYVLTVAVSVAAGVDNIDLGVPVRSTRHGVLARARPDRAARGDEPARRPGVGHARSPSRRTGSSSGVLVHASSPGCVQHRCFGARRRSPRARTSRSSPSPATATSPGWRCCSSRCARSPPAVRR